MGACIAGYKPATNVVEQAKIDRDIQEIISEMGNKTSGGFLAAQKLYETGKNSLDGAQPRSIKGFSIKPEEPLGKLYADFKWDPHAFVAAVLEGQDSADYGPFAKGSIASKYDARIQLVKKTIPFQILQLYAIHEIESALAKYSSANPDATHTWDEFWAFYAGSLEDGKATGYSAYMNAEKRSVMFKTNTAKMNNGGVSAVNDKLLRASTAGRVFTQAKDSNQQLNDIAKCMRAQIKVPVIQGCLEYAYKTDVSTSYSNTDDGEITPAVEAKAELFAFCSAALPFLHAVDAKAAEALRTEVTLVTDDKMPSFKTIKAAFSAANLNAMGIRCADVGSFSDFELCTDGSLTNADADSSKCSVVDGTVFDDCPLPQAAAAPALASQSLAAALLALAATLIAAMR